MNESVKGVITGVIIIFVSLILFGLIISQTDSARAVVAASSYNYTGVDDFLALTPLLVLLGLMGFGGWTVYTNVRRGSGKRRK